MSISALHFIVRTPHALIVDTEASSIRIPTETGQVGLRPRNEPQVIAVESGLILVRAKNAETLFVGTAGGLLICERNAATLLTPFAVSGKDRSSIMTNLQTALDGPSEEMKTRTMLAKLEDEILTEARRARGVTSSAQRVSR